MTRAPLLDGDAGAVASGIGSTGAAESALLAEAAELIEGSVSLEPVWGQLLIRGYEPEAIVAVLAQLRPDDEGTAALDLETTPALARQIALLGLIASRQGMVSGSEIPAVAGREMQALLAGSQVALITDDESIGRQLLRSLDELGIAPVHYADQWQSETDPSGSDEEDLLAGFDVAPGGDGTLVVCATHGVKRELASRVNRAAVAKGVAAVYYHLQGMHMQLGPLVVPGQTSCFRCYELRRSASLAPWERNLLENAEDGGQLALAMGVDWLAIDVVKQLTRLGEPVSRGRVLLVDYFVGIREIHPVLRLPRCTVCGVPRRPAVRLWDEPR